MRPLLLLAAAATLLVACSDDDDPTSPVDDVVGSYDLVSVNGQPLPQTVPIEGNDFIVRDFTFRSGNVTLFADGTCTNRLELLVEEDGEEPLEDNTTYECTYEVDGNDVITTDVVDGFVALRTWSGDELTWPVPGALMVFRR